METPPYGIIANKLREGRIVPFLGAGVNIGHREPRDAAWSAERSPLLRQRDLKDARGLALSLRSDEASSAYMRGLLPDETVRLLDAHQGAGEPSAELKAALVDGFNAWIAGPFDPDFLDRIGLPPAMRRDLLEFGSQKRHLAHRAILSALYPEFLAKWKEAPCEFLPLGKELSRFLASQACFPSREDHEVDNLAKTASYLVDADERKTLVRYLHWLLDEDYPPCSIHRYLAELSATLPKGVPLVVVTTNYDDLLERAFEEVERERTAAGLPTRPYDLVVHLTDCPEFGASVMVWPHGAGEPSYVAPMEVELPLLERTVIYKMHGSVVRNWRRKRSAAPADQREDAPGAEDYADSYVITEEDYVEFLAQKRVPASLMKHFRSRHFLFLGHGLADWNVRVLLHNLRVFERPLDDRRAPPASPAEKGSLPRSWAIQHNPSTLDWSLWKAKQVWIYDLDIDQFVDGLSAAPIISLGRAR